MRFNLKSFSLFLGLVLAAAAAQAQEVDEAAGAEAQEAPVAEAEGADIGISMGQPADEDQVGQTYVREVFTDWEMRCIRTADDRDPCQLNQLMRDAGGNPVAEFNLLAAPPGGEAAAIANVITPLETLLTANLRLAIDDSQAKLYPYAFCTQVGCFSRLGLTEEEVDRFRNGASATVTIVPAASPNEVVNVTLSLSGFTAGFTALQASEAARRDEAE